MPKTHPNRRTFLSRTSTGVGSLALGALLNSSLLAGQSGPSRPNDDSRWTGVADVALPPKCKRVIHLCMAGGPSHLETFDYKPKLAELD